MRAMIRLIETCQIEVTGEGLPDIHSKLDAAQPDGFELVSAPVAMLKGSTAITATGTYARRDETRMIEADTMDGLRALVPDGWQMLFVVR